MAEVDFADVFKTVAKSDPFGASGYSNVFANRIAKEHDEFMKNAFKIQWPIDSHALYNFDKFIKGSPRILSVTQHAVNHVEARLAQSFLLEYLFSTQKLDKFKIALLGTSLTEYHAFKSKYPLATIFPVFGSADPRDRLRLDKILLSTKYSHDYFSKEFNHLYANIRNSKTQMGRYMAIMEDFNELSGNFDVIVGVDSFYNQTPEMMRTLQLRTGAFTTIYIKHNVGEMFGQKGGEMTFLINPIFSIKWEFRNLNCFNKKIIMSFKDGSPAYVSSAKAMKKFSCNAFLPNFIWEPVFENFGYGLYKTSMVDTAGLAFATPVFSTAGLLIRAFDVLHYLKTGQLRIFFIDFPKYMKAREYGVGSVKIAEPLDATKMLTHLRGSEGKQIVGGTTLSQSWDLLDSNLQAILHFLILDISLARKEIKDLQRLIGNMFGSNLKFKWLMDLVSSISRCWERFKICLFGEGFTEWFESFKLMRMDGDFVKFSGVTKCYRTLANVDDYYKVLEMIDGMEDDDWEFYDKFKCDKGIAKTHANIWYNHSQQKLSDLLPFFSDVKLLHNFGCAPGGFSDFFYEKGFRIHNWHYTGADALMIDFNKVDLSHKMSTFGSDDSNYPDINCIEPIEGGMISDCAHCEKTDCLECKDLFHKLVGLVARSPHLGVAIIKSNVALHWLCPPKLADRTLTVLKPISSNPMSTEHYYVYQFSVPAFIKFKFQTMHAITLTAAAKGASKLVTNKILSLSLFSLLKKQIRPQPDLISYYEEEDIETMIRGIAYEFCKWWFKFYTANLERKLAEKEEEDKGEDGPILPEPSAPEEEFEDDEEGSSEDDSTSAPPPVVKDSKKEVDTTSRTEEDSFNTTLAFIERLSGLNADYKIADVGSGDSKFSTWCREKMGIQCYSYDINGKADVTIDATKSTPAQTFDVVLLSMSYHHIGKFPVENWLNSAGFVVMREHLVGGKYTAKELDDEHLREFKDKSSKRYLTVKDYKTELDAQGFRFVSEHYSRKGEYSVWLCYQKITGYDDWREKIVFKGQIPDCVPLMNYSYKSIKLENSDVSYPIPCLADRDVNNFWKMFSSESLLISAVKDIKYVRKGKMSNPFKHYKIVDPDPDGWCLLTAQAQVGSRDISLLEFPNRNPATTLEYAFRVGYAIPTIIRLQVNSQWYFFVSNGCRSKMGYVYIDMLNAPDHAFFMAPPDTTLFDERIDFPNPLIFFEKMTAVDFSLTKPQIKALIDLLIDDIQVSPPMVAYLSGKTARWGDGKLRKYFEARMFKKKVVNNMNVIDGPAGFGKTYLLAQMAVKVIDSDVKNLKKIAFVVSKQEGRSEFVDLVTKMLYALKPAYWKKNQEQLDKAIFKTHQVALLCASTSVEYLFNDECYTLPTYLLFAYARLYPNAKILCVGGSDQMTIDDDNYPKAKEFEKYTPLTLNLFFQERGLDKTAYRFGYTSRFGHRAIEFMRELGVESAKDLKTTVLRRTKIVIKDFKTPHDTSNGDYWMCQDKYQKGISHAYSTVKTIAASQGVSKDNVTLIWPEHGLSNMRELYVALTRMKQKLTILYKKEDQGAKLLNAYVPTARNYIGGTFRPIDEYVISNDRDHPNYLMPGEPFKDVHSDHVKQMAAPWINGAIQQDVSIYQRSYVPHTEPLTSQTFNAADLITLDHSWNSYNAHKESMVYVSPEIKNCTVYGEKLVNKEFEILALGDTVSGKRHFANSAVQSINTLMGRLTSAIKFQRIANRKFDMMSRLEYDRFFEKLMLRFFIFYVDGEKYDALLNSEMADVVLLECWNEFCKKVHWNPGQCENLVSNRFSEMTGMLKQQMKTKDKEAPFKNKGGQPVAAVSKVTVALYALIFRFMTRLMILSLYDQFMIASGKSNQEIAEWLQEHSSNTVQIDMGDFPEYDASQNRHSQNIVKMIFRHYCPDLVTLNNYYDEIGKKTIFFFVVMVFWGEHKASGTPDTLIGNVVLCMVVIVTMYPDGTVEWAIFLGDDSGVGLNEKIDVRRMNVYDQFFSQPMKMNSHPRVLEFCNHLFYDGTFVYNPYLLAAKIIQKNYKSVMSTRLNWEEWRLSINLVFWTVRQEFYKILGLCTDYFGTSREDMERLLVTLDNYCALSYENARSNLCLYDVVLNDEINIGGNGLNKIHNLTTNKQSTRMDYQTIATRELALRNMTVINTDVKTMGPAEALIWLATINVRVSDSSKLQFRSNSSKKDSAVKDCYRKIVEWLNQNPHQTLPHVNTNVNVNPGCGGSFPSPSPQVGNAFPNMNILKSNYDVEHQCKVLTNTINNIWAAMDQIKAEAKIEKGANEARGNLLTRLIEKIDSLGKLVDMMKNKQDEIIGSVKRLGNLNAQLNQEVDKHKEEIDELFSKLAKVQDEIKDAIILPKSDAFKFQDPNNNTPPPTVSLKSNWNGFEVVDVRPLENIQEWKAIPGGCLMFKATIDIIHKTDNPNVPTDVSGWNVYFKANPDNLGLESNAKPKWFNEIVKIADWIKNCEHADVLAERRNSEMHAYNGNVKGKAATKVAKTEAKKEAVKEVKKEVKKIESAIVKRKPARPRNFSAKPKKEKVIPKMNNIIKNIDSIPTSNNIKNLLEAVMLPYIKDARGYDWPRDMSDVDTFPKRMEQREDAPWDADVDDADMPYQFITRTHMFMLAFRSFLMNSILYMFNGKKDIFAYRAVGFDGESNVQVVNTNAFQQWKELIFCYATPVGTTSGGDTTTWAPNGSTWYPGCTEKYPMGSFYWLNRGDPFDGSTAGSHFALSIANNSSGMPMIIEVKAVCYTKQNGYSEVSMTTNLTTSIAASATGVFNLYGGMLDSKYAFGAYVCFQVKILGWEVEANEFINSDDGFSYSLMMNSNALGKRLTGYFAHRQHLSMETISKVVDQQAIIGMSLWYENDASANYKNGVLYDQQIPANTCWTWVAGNLQKVFSGQRTTVHKAAQGNYIFAKPNNKNSFDLVQEIESDGVYIQAAKWSIDSDQDYLSSIATVQQTDIGSAQIGVIRIGTNFAFVSQSQMFAPIRNPCTAYQGQTVLDLLRNRPQSYDNKNHLKQIGGFLKKVAAVTQKGLDYAKPLVDLMV